MRAIPPLIQWHEGMFLSPQHFQQMQRRFDSLLATHTDLFHHNTWGVTHLVFDKLTLADNLLRIAELKATLPNNAVIHYPLESSHKSLEIDLTPYKSDAQKNPLKVYLCMPETAEGQSETTGEWPCYDSVEGGPTADENLSDHVISIPRLHPKLSLIVADTYPPRYVSFPIAEVIHSDEAFVLTDFQPPLITINPFTFFHDQATSIASRIREKAQYLSSKWQKQVGTTFLSETANQLRPMIKILPLLEGSLRGQSLHPKAFYDLLCLVFGELSTMRLTTVPYLMPLYQHDNLNACLGDILQSISNLLDSVEQSVVILPFNQRERLFYLKMHASIQTASLLSWLRVPARQYT